MYGGCDAVTSLADGRVVSAGGPELIIADSDGAHSVWIVAGPNGHIEGPERRFTCVTGLSSGGFVAGDDQGDVLFLNAKGHVDKIMPTHRAAVRCVVEPEEGELVTGGDDRAVRAWKLRGERQVALYLDAAPQEIVVSPQRITVIDANEQLHRLERSHRYHPTRFPHVSVASVRTWMMRSGGKGVS
jgi:hypothetical protein